eukprot:2741927-Amphidinium_carterae.1
MGEARRDCASPAACATGLKEVVGQEVSEAPAPIKKDQPGKKTSSLSSYQTVEAVREPACPRERPGGEGSTAEGLRPPKEQGAKPRK